jgi:methylated-DNA-[protein]-cysteine S-methyltransferase
MAGSPRGGRAAGNALNRCPIELFVPCHRVVHAGGSIGGYGRHTERKRFLIALEAGPADTGTRTIGGRSPRGAR